MDILLDLPGVVARDAKHDDLRNVNIRLRGVDESLQGRSHVPREGQVYGRGRQRHEVHDILRVPGRN